MENLIFQYIILSDTVDGRGEIEGRKRTEVYQEMADISRRSFEIYAEKIGSDYLFSTEQVVTKGHDNPTSYLFECLRVIYDESFDKYDKVLFLDTDIVCNTFENIFEESDAEVFGVYESDIRTDRDGGYNTWDYDSKTYNNYCRKFNYHNCPIVPVLPPNHPSRITIFNTGVLVWTREARIKARKCFDDWKSWLYDTPEMHMSIVNDQPFISSQLIKHDFDIESIDQKWNDTPTHYNDVEGKGLQSNFLHYTGGNNKIVMIDQYHRGLFKIFNGEL